MAFFAGCIVGYFVNKYDEVVVSAIRRWWSTMERKLGIKDDDTNTPNSQ